MKNALTRTLFPLNTNFFQRIFFELLSQGTYRVPSSLFHRCVIDIRIDGKLRLDYSATLIAPENVVVVPRWCNAVS